MAATTTTRWPNSLVTLAIETSCDDTCVAVLEKEKDDESANDTNRSDGADRRKRRRRPRARLLFEERITADNRAFGGIHPLTSAESHMAALAPLVQRALQNIPSHGGDAQNGTGSGAGAVCSSTPKPDFVAATRGPGMASSLAMGLAVAKGLAVAWQIPLVGVHHMQAHALTPRLVEAMEADEEEEAIQPEDEDGPPPSAQFSYLSFLVSGGHTMLVHSRALNDHGVLASAANIAVGDLLDKCARAILPRGYIAAAEAKAGRSLPYGALLEKFAFDEEATGEEGRPYGGYRYPAARRDEMAPFESGRGWQLEAPLGKGALRKALRFDFSGLNGTVIKVAGGDPSADGSTEKDAASDEDDGSAGASEMPDDERRLLARATMQLAFEHLASRLLLALDAGAGGGGGGGGSSSSSSRREGEDDKVPPPTCLVVSGGVASNQFLRHVLRSALDVRGYGHLPVVAPPPALCTDNAAMIAWASMEMYEAGWQTDLGVLPIRKWSMDADAEDGGILGPSGWLRRP